MEAYLRGKSSLPSKVWYGDMQTRQPDQILCNHCVLLFACIIGRLQQFVVHGPCQGVMMRGYATRFHLNPGSRHDV